MKYKCGQTLINKQTGNRFAIIGIHDVKVGVGKYNTVYELASTTGAKSRWNAEYMRRFDIESPKDLEEEE
jgi:hypothetical protein